MTFSWRLSVAVLALPLVLVGCTDRGAPTPAPTVPISRVPNPGAPAPSAALAPRPSVRSGTDARTLLAPGGDIERLAMKVPGDLERLESAHVEEYYSAGPTTLSYDVDYHGRCSGVLVDHGHAFRFVTSDDGHLLVTTDRGEVGRRLAGRWLTADHLVTGVYCADGPRGVAMAGAGRQWLLHDATRVGVERVGGRRSVHFHKVDGTSGTVADSWIAAEGETSRLLKVVRTVQGNVHTIALSRFDHAGPIADLPPDDLVIQGQSGPAAT